MTSFIDGPTIFLIGGDGLPPNNNPFNGKRIPEPLLNMDDDGPMLTSDMLAKINKAITSNDDRADISLLWHKCRAKKEPAVHEFCNIVYSDDCEFLLQLADRMHSTLPVIADINRLNGVFSNQNNNDWGFVSKSDCSEDGVKRIDSDIIKLMNYYFNLFEDLEQVRDELSDVTDIFQYSLAQYQARSETTMTDMSTHENQKAVYQRFKQNIESQINDFHMTLADYRGRLSRMLAQRKAMRVGWGYHLYNRNNNFLVLIRYKPLSYKRPTDPGSLNNYLWTPQIKKDPNRNQPPRMFKRETNTSPAKPDLTCVTEITGLNDLTKQIDSNAANFQVFSFIEDDLIMVEKIETLRTAYYMWISTTKGWYYNRYEYDSTKPTLENLIALCKNPQYDLGKRLRVLKEMTAYFKMEMSIDLKWYYYPYHSFYNVVRSMTDYHNYVITS